MAKVLVVEDDNNLREIYETSLKAEGYETYSAADGMEALEVAGRNKPDLIISDVMMPRLSGFEMLEKMRQDQSLKDIPVIMMTALSMAEDKDTAKRLGVVHYLVKSQVTLEDFVSVAKKFVPADGSAAAAPSTDQPASEPAASPAPQAEEPSKAEEASAQPVPSPAPAPESTTSSEPAAPSTDQPASEPAASPTPQAEEPSKAEEAPAQPVPSQSTTEETSAVEAQIQEFVDTQQQDTDPEASATETTSAAEPNTDSQGKKIIQPPVSEDKKDIHELAKAEEAKEQAQQPAKNPSAGSSVDPNSIAL